MGGLSGPALGASAGPLPGEGAASIARDWLQGYSAEVTTPDRKSLDAAAELMWPQAPVYVASLPKDSSEAQLAVAAHLHELGLRPVPHVVARNFASEAAFARAIERFSREAGVDRALGSGRRPPDERGSLRVQPAIDPDGGLRGERHPQDRNRMLPGRPPAHR
jgi:hypothetical protein